MKLIFISLLILSAFCLSAQDILSMGRGAAGISMGNITTVHTDILAVYGNEAGLGFLDRSSIYASAEKRYSAEGLNYLSLAGAYPSPMGTLGMTVQYYGFEDFNEMMIGLAYGKRLFDKLALGVQFDYLQARIPAYGKKSSYTVELGLLSFISPEVSVGFHMFNPFQISWAEEEQVPAIMNLGVKYEPTKNFMVMGELEKTTDVKPNIRVGLQYYMVGKLALRFGMNTNPALYSFGVGYAIDKGLQMDIGSTIHQSLGLSPVGGIGYTFDTEQP